MYKKLIVAGFLIAGFAFFSTANAQALTTAQIDAIISLLRSFGAEENVIANVENNLYGRSSGSGGSDYPNYCPQLNYNLYLDLVDEGTEGEVSKLQKFLAQYSNIYPEGNITGFFGPSTERAVQRWQAQNGVVSSGSPETTGYGVVGPKTREAINKLCGKVTNPNPIPVTESPYITSTGAKAAGNFEMDAGGELWIYGTNLVGKNSVLPKVFIGNTESVVKSASKESLTVSVPVSLTSGLTYNVYISNENGVSNTVYVKVLGKSGSPPPVTSAYPSITVIYPNGGEILTFTKDKDLGLDFMAKWKYVDLVGNVTAYLKFTDGLTCKIKTVPVSENYMTASLGENYKCPNANRNVTPGQYKVLLEPDNGDSSKPNKYSDESDNYFVVNHPTQQQTQATFRVSSDPRMVFSDTAYAGQEKVMLGRYNLTAESKDIKITSFKALSSASVLKMFKNIILFNSEGNVVIGHGNITNVNATGTPSQSQVDFNISFIVPAGTTKNVFFLGDLSENAPSETLNFNFFNLGLSDKNAKIEYSNARSLTLKVEPKTCLTDSAQFVSQDSIPTSITAGKEFTVTLKMKNTGCSTWVKDNNNPFSLGVRPVDNYTWRLGRISAMEKEVKPGEIGTFTATLAAPKIAGTYQFQWQMVKEYFRWFGELTKSVMVTVTNP